MTNANGWFYAKNTESIGPLSLADLVKALPGAEGGKTLVFGPGLSEWTEAKRVAAIADALRSPGGPPKPPGNRRADVIDYEIFGEEMQFVEITLDPGEMVIAEAGAMMYMTSEIKMETVFGDPSAQEKQGFTFEL